MAKTSGGLRRSNLSNTNVISRNLTDLIIEAGSKGYRYVKVKFKPAYDEKTHGFLNPKDKRQKRLIKELQKSKIKIFDVVNDGPDLIQVINLDLFESINFTKNG